MTAKLRYPHRLVTAATQNRIVSGQHFVASLPELFARWLRELHAAHQKAPILCVSILLAVRRLGGWSLHPVVLPPSGPITGARHGCSAQARQADIRNNRNTPSAPAKWTLCRPWRGAEQGLLLLSHTIARLQSAPWRKGVPSANAWRDASLADRAIWPHVNDQRTSLRDTLRRYSRMLHKKAVLVMAEVPCFREV